MFVLQAKLGEMQNETTVLIQTWEKEEQKLKQSIETYKVYFICCIYSTRTVSMT